MLFVHTGVMVDVSQLKIDASVFERSFFGFSGIRKNRIFELAELEQLTFFGFLPIFVAFINRNNL